MSPRTRVAALSGALRIAEKAATKNATPISASTAVVQKVDDLDVEIRRVDLAANAEFGLPRQKEAEGPVDRLLRRSADAASRF